MSIGFTNDFINSTVISAATNIAAAAAAVAARAPPPRAAAARPGPPLLQMPGVAGLLGRGHDGRAQQVQLLQLGRTAVEARLRPQRELIGVHRGGPHWSSSGSPSPSRQNCTTVPLWGVSGVRALRGVTLD